MKKSRPTLEPKIGQHISLQGVVQGVGMRPTLWHIATQIGITGSVRNTDGGVYIEAWGTKTELAFFVSQIQSQAPTLANIQSIQIAAINTAPASDFTITESTQKEECTSLPADAATCSQCIDEIFNPGDRRFRYPFTTCTHCGPRLSILYNTPFDRANTSMVSFEQCADCLQEYNNPSNRRYHSQANACPKCGPQVWLEDNIGKRTAPHKGKDVIEVCGDLIKAGKIIAVKGLGGFHLTCDATNESAVARLRDRKQRPHKALALMAKNSEVIQRYAACDETELALLKSNAAPIVILSTLKEVKTDETLPKNSAPNQNTLGFMLSYTPLLHLLLNEMDHPIVMTSGNQNQQPQCTDNETAKIQLNAIADYFLLNDREIVSRCDDSIMRVANNTHQIIRRARGFAPEPLKLFMQPSPKKVLAMGAELKSTLCLLHGDSATLSQHMGDLKNTSTFNEYQHILKFYKTLFNFEPDLIVVDQHPDYLSTQLGQNLSKRYNVPLLEVQHHHAHIAACMAEHQLPLEQPVLGIALDGLGMGENDQIWGGEFLKVTPCGYKKLAGFTPIAMLGGTKAIQEPWRNTVAHLFNSSEWPQLQTRYADTSLFQFLQQKPLSNLEIMYQKSLNSPKASSAGRLFDAVAAAVGICRQAISYEGQAAIELESIAAPYFYSEAEAEYAYTFELHENEINWHSMWRQLLDDLQANISAGVIAARFHHCVINAVVHTAATLAQQHELSTIILCGGVMQNQLLLNGIRKELKQKGLTTLSPHSTPANDGGISLGQAVVGMNYISTTRST